MWGKIKKWFKSNDENQECLIIGNDSRMFDASFKVVKDWMIRESEDSTEAYVLDAENTVRRKGDGALVQVITGNDVVPVAMRGVKNRDFGRTQMNQAGKMIVAQTLLKIEKQNAKDQIIRNLTLLVAIPCLTVLIIVAVNLANGAGVF